MVMPSTHTRRVAANLAKAVMCYRRQAVVFCITVIVVTVIYRVTLKQSSICKRAYSVLSGI